MFEMRRTTILLLSGLLCTGSVTAQWGYPPPPRRYLSPLEHTGLSNQPWPGRTATPALNGDREPAG